MARLPPHRLASAVDAVPAKHLGLHAFIIERVAAACSSDSTAAWQVEIHGSTAGKHLMVVIREVIEATAGAEVRSATACAATPGQESRRRGWLDSLPPALADECRLVTTDATLRALQISYGISRHAGAGVFI